MSVKKDIANLMRGALDRAQNEGLLPPAAVEDVPVERPQDPSRGDFASSLPMKLARPMRMAPMAIAETVAGLVPAGGFLKGVSAARPGFINFSLDEGWLARQVDAIRKSGPAYGNVDVGVGQRVQVEFVSVNPTGPLHVGHARGAVIGSTLADILAAAGYTVQREYYVNDAGNQMDLFNRTLYARYLQAFDREAELPTGGYQGAYMADLAAELKSEEGDRLLKMPEREALSELGKPALAKMLGSIRRDLDELRVRFDLWFSEQSLFSGGQYQRAMRLLEERGFVADRDGARWFASSGLGEDKDNVLVRGTGAPTYLATDVAYHYNKLLERKFDRVINIWGADHHGHVPRMKAVVSALGVSPERLVVIITQLVSFKRGGEVVRISKRTGDVVTVRELVQEVGVDACRFLFLSRSAESQMEFDLELAKRESAENPVYNVQYAHARIVGILRLAAQRGIMYEDADLSLLTHEAELALIRKLLMLPELVEMMADSLEPHHLPHHAMEVATAFHWFYQQCRVVSSEPEDAAVTAARLKLVDASRTVLARCLGLMSMSAPEEM